MVEELITIEQLEQIKRLLDGGRVDLAAAIVDSMIQRKQETVDQFELEFMENVPV